jgi:hypothetical protein
MYSVSEVRKAYNANGVGVVSDFIDLQADQHLQALVRVTATAEEVAADNFNRGALAALHEVSKLLKAIA